MEFEQKKREVELALKLRDLLKGYINATDAERVAWRTKVEAKAVELCNHSFGDAMVEAVGWVYENYSCQFLGKLDTFLGLGGKYAKLQARSREANTFWRIAGEVCNANEEFLGSAVRASIAARKLSKLEEKSVKAKRTEERSGKDPSESFLPGEEHKARVAGAKQFEEALPLILETMLQICLLDIEATVRKAAKKVLKDLQTPIEIRRQRAEAMIEVGKIFQQKAQQHKNQRKDVPVDLLRNMEEAYVRAAAEADKESQPPEK